MRNSHNISCALGATPINPTLKMCEKVRAFRRTQLCARKIPHSKDSTLGRFATRELWICDTAYEPPHSTTGLRGPDLTSRPKRVELDKNELRPLRFGAPCIAPPLSCSGSCIAASNNSPRSKRLWYYRYFKCYIQTKL